MKSLFGQNVNLVVAWRRLGGADERDLLRFAFSVRPLAALLEERLGLNRGNRDGDIAIALPQDWPAQVIATHTTVTRYCDRIPVPDAMASRSGADWWFIVSDAGFITQMDYAGLCEALTRVSSDVVAVRVEPRLGANRERVVVDPQGKLIGFRLLYRDKIGPGPVGDDWPHHLFIRASVLSKLLKPQGIPSAFAEFLATCRKESVEPAGITVGGSLMDLRTEQGLLDFLATGLTRRAADERGRADEACTKAAADGGPDMAAGARLFGEILFGRNVTVGQDAIIVGPAVVADEVDIGQAAVVRFSIIGPQVSVPRHCLIENQFVTDSGKVRLQSDKRWSGRPAAGVSSVCGGEALAAGNFRAWTRFSYARFFKRLVDVVVAALILVVFAPVLPIISLAVKLSSRGPVFFRDVRQGLHGKPFQCLKFRTMRLGADDLQEKLRVINEADGPQFVITDDPRSSGLGRFLRDTYLDEIPQFFNVLAGQMSVVGPRPSPEAENIMCPFWRDARLSVRPGITGLWQVRRTRRPMKDFQEWIHYDVEYVRNLSLALDLRICWETARKLFKTFVSQF